LNYGACSRDSSSLIIGNFFYRYSPSHFVLLLFLHLLLFYITLVLFCILFFFFFYPCICIYALVYGVVREQFYFTLQSKFRWCFSMISDMVFISNLSSRCPEVSEKTNGSKCTFGLAVSQIDTTVDLMLQSSYALQSPLPSISLSTSSRFPTGLFRQYSREPPYSTLSALWAKRKMVSSQRS